MSFNAKVVNYDPYRKFKFQVSWDGNPVAGVSKVTGLSKTTEAIEHRTGGDPNYVAKIPGLTKYDPITLERGLTADQEFIKWMNLVNTWQAKGGQENAENFHNFRKDIKVEAFNLANEKILTIVINKSWPSKVAIGDFDAKANEVNLETLELQHEGWYVQDPTGTADER